jgi:hypothetical protein
MVHRAENSRDDIAREVSAWHTTGLRIAVWGGTGEAAAFLGAYGLDDRRFPIVVDSDPGSVGTSVRGSGQMIRFRDWLLDHPVDIILIPCQRRAAEIVREIDAARIAYEGILIPREGHLVDFHAAEIVLA